MSKGFPRAYKVIPGFNADGELARIKEMYPKDAYSVRCYLRSVSVEGFKYHVNVIVVRERAARAVLEGR